MTFRYGILAPLVLIGIVASCADQSIDAGDTDMSDSGPPPPSFTADDASAPDANSKLVSYCPSNKCPAGHTTCPQSLFPCDVDLETDLQNCGACGVVCPSNTNDEQFSCIDGQCVMSCSMGNLDCDGVPDNGCETSPSTNENCGGCGVRCLDPDKPCIRGGCGCPPGQTYCNSRCINTQGDDENCGACGNVCDPLGDGGALFPDTYFGCSAGTCGYRKCVPGRASCDGIVENGCETVLGTDTNCTGCGHDCTADGQKCYRTPLPALSPFCGCPEGQTFCGSPVFGGLCVDLTSDTANCGGCGRTCGTGTVLGLDPPVCEYGTCVQHCPYGRADCDGNPGCEVGILSDPRNCGACGIACDAVQGQACVGGRCVVEPCEQGDGGMAR